MEELDCSAPQCGWLATWSIASDGGEQARACQWHLDWVVESTPGTVYMVRRLFT